MDTELSKRRAFLKQLAVLTTGIMAPIPMFTSCSTTSRDSIGDVLPTRILGKTGERVTMLGLGGYHIGWTTEKDAEETIEAALEGGIRFFDSAESYGPHTGEIRYGKYLVPKHRDHIFLMTKTAARDAKTARTHLEESLKRMNCDYIDLWQVHSITTPDDVNNRIDQGVLKVFEEAKASGKVKYIGFTGHQNPYGHETILEKTNEGGIFDTCQMPISVVDAGSKISFINLIMSRLVKGNLGVIAMKTLADGRFFANKKQLERQVWQSEDPVVPGRITLEQAMNFAWSLPISTLVTGAENAEMLREKIPMAKSFLKMSEQERNGLMDKVADIATDGKVEYYKRFET
jgi:uncharacterized protein